MNIGIVGTGNMGRTLGGRWAAAGHAVVFGARRQEGAREAEEFARAAGAANVHAGSNREAAAFGDVVLYCLRGVDPVLVLGGASLLRGKTLIDLNNTAIPAGFEFEPQTVSLAETLQTQLPDARVVKAFNMLAQEIFEVERDELERRGVSALIATDDMQARTAVEILARDLGLIPVNAGPLRNARLLETGGDLIRYLIMEAGMGPFATLSVVTVQPRSENRFGGRRPSSVEKEKAQPVGSTERQVNLESSGVVDAPVKALWGLVSDFNNIARWHPDVTESRLESGSGREPGAVRSIRLRNGVSIRERLVHISPQDHSYTYSVIESPLPIRDYQSTITFTAIHPSQTQVKWTARFVVVEGDADELADGVQAGVLDLGIAGLRRAASTEEQGA